MAFTIASAAAKLSRKLPEDALDRVAHALLDLPNGLTTEQTVQAVTANIASPAARAAVAKLVKRWRKRAPNVTGQALGHALMAAGTATSQMRAMQSEELVWSGPRPPGTMLRRIDAALYELIDGATESLTIVTFAAYDIPRIRERVLAALDRGVIVTLILESKEFSEGALKVSPLLALGNEIAKRSRVLVGPPDKRPSGEDGKPGVLHAKCAVADGQKLLVSSANLTGSAMEANMELGMLVSGGELPREVERHFTQLESAQELSRLG